MTNFKILIWCATVILGTLDTAKALSFIFYNGSLTNTFETAADDPLPLLSYIDKSKNTTVLAGGVGNKKNGTAIITMILAYLSRNDTNVMLLNWENESQTDLGTLGYGIVIARLPGIASTVAASFVKLFQNNVLPSRFRLVGHSAGAHLMGMIGTKTQKSNYTIASICGLDPAGPGFESSSGIERLNPSQATNVFTIITNAGQYGSNEGLGSINFWVNCSPSGRQPGCPFVLFPLPSPNAYCSHDRCWMILAEALRRLGIFPAAKATSCIAWKSNTSPNVEINYIGDEMDPNKKGDFYLSTNSQSLFSKGQAGLRPN